MKNVKYDMLIVYYIYNMSYFGTPKQLICPLVINNIMLDKIDKIKLTLVYYKCKTLNLTDIVLLIINYAIDTQQYAQGIKYNIDNIQYIIINDILITEHTTHLLFKMLLQKYPNFNELIKCKMSCITYVQTERCLIIKHWTINNNILTLTLDIRNNKYEYSRHRPFINAISTNFKNFILEL